MNVTYDYYRIFYYVCRYGSFTKAAQMIGSSQPNITRAMNNLESQLGVVLLLRNKHGITPTEEGEKLYQRVKVAHEQIAIAEQEIVAAKNLESGVVTIGVSEIALHEILLPVLSEFRKKYPNIIIKITNESTPSAIRSLQEDAVDFALVTTPVPEGISCKCEEIRQITEYPVASKASLDGWNLKGRISIREITQLPLVMLAEETSTRCFYESIFAEYGLHMNPQMIASTADQILPMVKAGLGIGFLPESMIENDETVLRMELTEQLPKRSICLVSGAMRPLSVAARMIMDEIRIHGD